MSIERILSVSTLLQMIEVLRGIIDDYRQQAATDFQFQTSKIEHVFSRMKENAESFVRENMTKRALLWNWLSSTRWNKFKSEFEQRVNESIDANVSQCITDLCGWLVNRWDRAIHQLNAMVAASSLRSPEKHRHVDVDFSRSREQILQQLQSQSSNVNSSSNESQNIFVFLAKGSSEK